jgi:ubiquinone/menaquinone biosynthesis C-methylase UbiE
MQKQYRARLSQMQRLWDANAMQYDEFASSYPLYRESSRLLVDSASIRPGMVIVDLGCGTGITTSAILKRLKNRGLVIGVDISSKMIEIAKSRITSKCARFLHAPAEEFDRIISQRVDRIICNFSFWQFQDKQRVIAAASKLLKPDGLLLFNSSIDMDGPSIKSYSDPLVDLILDEKKAIPTVKKPDKKTVASRPAAPKPRSKQRVLDLRRYGLKAMPLKEYELEFSAEERIAFYRIPCMGGFLHDLTKEQRTKVLDAAEKKLGKNKSLAVRVGLWGDSGCILHEEEKHGEKNSLTVRLCCTVLAIERVPSK